MNENDMNKDYECIERAIHFIRSHVSAQPGLEEIASSAGLSPFHFQRLFRRWAGISPKRFLEYLTVNYAKKSLNNAKNILDTSYDLGLTSAARLHDQFISIEAMTPGEYKTQGRGLRIRYGIHDSPFGAMLLAQTDRGVCAISFIADNAVQEEIDVLQQQWPYAKLINDTNQTSYLAGKIFTRPVNPKEKIHLTVRGTNFQINVWKALLKIPSGEITSYQQLAASLGKPNAYRAVATAVAANPIGYLIPCHRILRSSGDIGEYHWGADRKLAMVAWEAAHNSTSNEDIEKPTQFTLQQTQNKRR
jgi:AraC family transcriptional regulator, regulatory protein of adaptative response / methylated-DNA-[protein]-cysteine methyltransferase